MDGVGGYKTRTKGEERNKEKRGLRRQAIEGTELGRVAESTLPTTTSTNPPPPLTQRIPALTTSTKSMLFPSLCC